MLRLQRAPNPKPRDAIDHEQNEKIMHKTLSFTFTPTRSSTLAHEHTPKPHRHSQYVLPVRWHSTLGAPNKSKYEEKKKQNENQHENDEVGNSKSNEDHRRRRQTKKVDLLLVDA